ncbi:unnamed protein product [Alternaria alternata]
MEDKYMAQALAKGLEEMFKLFKPQSTSNLVAFDAHGRIHKYASVLDIIEEFYHVRLRYYEKRKQHQLQVMEKEHLKMTNQARFIQMIIDGKLTVSKKKKAVLVQELKKLGFAPFPKVEDAKAAGEVNANDYDYLLGMAISVSYSGTRREALKQIGEKQHEIDTLIKMSPKDILNVYLDAFMDEFGTFSWRKRSNRHLGSTAPQKQGTLLAHLVKKKEETPQPDGGEDGRSASVDSAPAPAPAKRGRPAAAKPIKKDPVSDDEDSDVFAAVAQEAAKVPSKTTASRTARSAKKAAPKYTMGSDSDDDSDDLLGDVSSMVKTIGSGTNGVPMFKATTTARPAPAAKKNSSPIEIDGDTTNYEGLMPQSSPQRPPPRNVHDTIMSSDEDDFDLGAKKPVASRLTAKPKAATAKPAPKPKAVAKKPAAQSPAAKAYAKKHGKDADAAKPAPKAKKQITIDSDDDEEMEDADAIANDILSGSDDDEPTPKPKAAARAPAARPGRRAAAKPAKYVVSDDEAESDEASEPSFDDDDDSE